MVKIVGVRFRNAGKVYYFDPKGYKIKAGDHVIGAERTVEDCDRLLLASTIAGMAITHTGTALPHGLSDHLTYENHVPHGRAVGYFLPGLCCGCGCCNAPKGA